MVGTEYDPRPFWYMIYGKANSEGSGPTYLGVFSGFRPPLKDQKHGEPNKNELGAVTEKYFTWPEEAEQAAQWVQEESQKGREVYQCSHLLSDKKRVKENAVSLIALYADGDGAKIPDWMLPPDVVVESSPGREHYYWVLTEPVTPEAFEKLNRTVTYAIGADRSKWGLATLLRVPGTKNHKYKDTPVVRVKVI